MRTATPLLALVTALACACGPAASTPTPTSAAPATGATASATPSATAVAGAWRRVADLPTARSEVATVVSEQLGRVFVIGGQGGPQRVELYDPATDRWERGPDLPIGVDHAMAAAAEGLQSAAPQGIFVFGGYVGGNATARSFHFDATARRWEEIAPMPGPRAAGAAVYAGGGSIFIVGGQDGSRLIAPTYAYDLTARTWRTVAPIPTPRDHLAAVALAASVCAVGGRRLSLSENVRAFECYDPRSDRWTGMPDAPTARGGLGAAVSGLKVYVAGGEQPSGTYRELEIFDLATNAWARGADLPTARHGLGVVVIQATKAIDPSKNLVFTPARLLVMAGGPTPGGSQTAVCEAIDLP